MNTWLQEKYILLLSNRLDRFKRVSSNLFNFRCYFCGDSEKNKTKTRGYLHKKKENYYYYCHNCGKSCTFENALKEVDPELYFDMKKESYGDSHPQEKIEFIKTVKKIETTTVLDHLPTIDSLPKHHAAKSYLINRKISKLDSLYYCENFKDFVNSVEPEKFTSNKHAIPRIIIPFYDKNNNLFGFQGRAVDPKEEIRYISIILDNSKPKAYNINQVNFNKKYYVFEGPFDSMFIDNSMAVCGSDVISVLNSMNANKENAVIVFDNEPRNPDIVKNISRAIDIGWKVCIWPDFWEHKDINDSALAGNTSSEINAIIDFNTCEGITAKLKLSQWRKDER